MKVDWLQLAQFCFIALAFVLAGATLGRTHTRWLGALFVAVGCHGALARLGFLAATPMGRYSYAVAMTYGPLFFLALRSLLRQEAIGPMGAGLVLGSAALGSGLIAAGISGGSGLGIIATTIQTLALAGVYRELRGYEAVIEQSRSEGTAPALRWVWSAFWLYAAVVAVLSLRAVLAPGLGPDLRATLDLAVAVAIALTLAGLTARVLADPDWIPRTTAAERDLVAGSPVPAGGPSAEQLARHRELAAHLAAHRPYLDPELSVRALADQLGWPPRQLSEVINRVDGCSFSQKINALRIAEAKRLLAAPDRPGQTLLDIALQSGFNSKSAFNLMFKRLAGCTPTEFRANLRSTAS